MGTSTSSVFIEAPRETVWAVVTEPGHVRAWQFGSVLDTDWRVGSPVRFTAGDYRQDGEVLAVEPPERLRYTVATARSGADVADVADVADEVTMTYSLEVRDGCTVLTIVQEDPRDVVPDAVDDEQAVQVLAALKAYAEAAPGS